MGERWVTLRVAYNENLKCFQCSKEITDQVAHLYLNVTDEIEEVLCERCWKKERKMTNVNIGY
jgi:hypothetical protein